MNLYRVTDIGSTVPPQATDIVVPALVSINTGRRLWLETPLPNDMVSESALIEKTASGTLAGIYLVGADGWPDVEKCGHLLAVAEAEAGLDEGTLRVIAVVGTPAGVLSLKAAQPAPARLHALVFDACRLAQAMNARESATAIASHTAASIALAAHAAGVPALYLSGVQAADAMLDVGNAARENGFSGMVVCDKDALEISETIFG